MALQCPNFRIMKKPVEYKSKGPLLSRSNVDSLVMHKETVTGEEEN